MANRPELEERRTTTAEEPLNRPGRPKRASSGMVGWIIAIIVAIIVIIAAASYWQNAGNTNGGEAGSPSTAEQPGPGDTNNSDTSGAGSTAQ